MIPSNWKTNQLTDELYKKMQILLENRVYIYKIPKEWNTIKSGLIDIISEVLNLKIMDVFRVQIDHAQYNTIGRICKTSTSTYSLFNLLTLIKEKLNIPSLQYLGDLESPAQQISIIIGHPLTSQILKSARKANIDTILCANFTYKTIRLAEELDINLINMTNYIVNLGLLKLSQALRMEQPRTEFIFINLKPSIKTF